MKNSGNDNMMFPTPQANGEPGFNNCSMTKRICQVTTDTINYLQPHIKTDQFAWIGVHVRNSTVTPTFGELVRMRVLTQIKGPRCGTYQYDTDQVFLKARLIFVFVFKKKSFIFYHFASLKLERVR